MLFTSNFMKLFLFFALFTKHVDNVTTEARIYMQCAASSQNLAPVAEYFVSKSHKYHLHQNHIAGSFSLVKFMGREDSQEKLPDLRQTQNINHKVKRKIWLHIQADLSERSVF